MGSGAKSEAIRLVESANQLIASLASGEAAAEAHTDRAERAFDHGLSRRVDHRIRQTSVEAPAWADVTVDQVDDLVTANRGMLVILGSHPNGRIREAAIRRSSAWIDPDDPINTRKPPAGITRMLAQRSLDATPPVRDAAAELITALFTNELRPEFRGRMPTGVERAAREIVAQTKSVVLCPQLVDTALDLFACRVGRYSLDNVRDHHQHTLQEVDRREQVLDELKRLAPTLAEEPSIAVAARLIEFYERSMRPVKAGDEGAFVDTGHIPNFERPRTEP